MERLHQVTFPHAFSSASPIFEIFLESEKARDRRIKIYLQAAAFTADRYGEYGATVALCRQTLDLLKASSLLLGLAKCAYEV